MPVTPTYPGVYIEEIPSGVRTIVGVATAITAFIGRTTRGPVNDPQTINSFADFERKFGGLAADYPLSYAVRDFYLNGGSQAIIVRLYKKPVAAVGDGCATFTFTTPELKLKACSEGTWGNQLGVKVDDDNITEEVVQRYRLPAAVTFQDFFNLTIVDGPPNGPREVFRNVSLHPQAGARRVNLVLESESNLVRFDGDMPKNAVQLTATDEDKDPTNRDNFDPKTGGPKTGKAIAKFKDGADSEPLSELEYLGKDANNNSVPKTGIRALDKVSLFNLLCIAPDVRADQETAADITLHTSIYADALTYCADRRAMLIVDPPAAWGKNAETAVDAAQTGLKAMNLGGTIARNAALYFPWLKKADPLREGQLDLFAPSGTIAGIMARTDRERGVWKAPAGLDAALNGIQGLQVDLNDDENGQLNPLGINCLRSFPVNGKVVWGARTLRGADQLADEYKYVPVRRTALFIEESLYRGLQWVVFEPNDEPLWAQIRLNVGAFMHNLFRQGAFQGTTPRDAYLVKCDKETTTQTDINLGIVNIVVGFAPLKPAEFVIIKIQQLAGQIQV